MKRILITLMLIIASLSINAQDSEYKQRLKSRFYQADSVFQITHQKEISYLKSENQYRFYQHPQKWTYSEWIFRPFDIIDIKMIDGYFQVFVNREPLVFDTISFTYINFSTFIGGYNVY